MDLPTCMHAHTSHYFVNWMLCIYLRLLHVYFIIQVMDNSVGSYVCRQHGHVPMDSSVSSYVIVDNTNMYLLKQLILKGKQILDYY